MVLDGRSIIDKKFITFNDEYPLVDTEDQIQPNGVDLRVNKLYEAGGNVDLPREGKAKANLIVQEIEPKDGWFELRLQPRLYWVDFLETAYIGDGWCAQLIARSSLVRSGVDVMAGLWDTGWHGVLGCTLRVHSPVKLEWGAKVCQIVFHEAKFNGDRYNGRYQNKPQSAIAE